MLAVISSPIFAALMGAVFGLAMISVFDSLILGFWLVCSVSIVCLANGWLTAQSTIDVMELIIILRQVVLFAVCLVIVGWFVQRFR